MKQIAFFILAINFTLYFGTGIYIIKKDKKSNTNILFFLLSICMAIWALGYAFMSNSKNIYQANIFRIISSIGWCFLPSIWLEFALSIRYESKKTQSIFMKIIIYLIPLLLFIKMCRYDPRKMFINTSIGLGDKYECNGSFLLFTIYCVIFFTAGILIIYSWGKIQKRTEKRNRLIQLLLQLY